MMPMRLNIYLVLALLTTGSSVKGQAAVASAAPAVACNVTAPNGKGPSFGDGSAPGYGNGVLAVSVWRDGTVVFKPGGAGFVLPDGSLSMKFGWIRGTRGRLEIEGHRLDASAPPLRANIPDG